MTTPKNTICLWFESNAEEAARFYAATFPDSTVTAVHHAPADYPAGKAGDVLTVSFTVLGIPCLGLNGGPLFPHTEAFSFQVATDTQDETDRYWNSIVGNGGRASTPGSKKKTACRRSPPNLASRGRRFIARFPDAAPGAAARDL